MTDTLRPDEDDQHFTKDIFTYDFFYQIYND